ncbi:MraY family glycosyltransferase [Massilia brevitalea]|uniref:MraY family glycosyltransferase n=1 Tax=Massilia brevitalea TaxID=442526 RepID=UPI00273921CF|nr:glycosyltransferase [Massilia brevitalea]
MSNAPAFHDIGSVPLQLPAFSFLPNLLVACVVSFSVCILIVTTQRWHGRFSLDSDTGGVQKVHKKSVPRTGGLALCAGVLAAACVDAFATTTAAAGTHAGSGMLLLLIASVPAFSSGVMEDLTKAVTPKKRLFAILASACLAVWLLGASLPRVDVWGIDGMLVFIPFSIAITVFAVAGITNSINIIDGFHGVAGIAIVIMLTGMGIMAWRCGDMLILQLAATAIGATIGFLMLNYPTGRLFMGDGGAYLLGFLAAEIAVLTIMRNPGINAWQILAIYAYPVIEVLFSIYRRTMIYGTRAGAPDRLHLHSLFYRRCARQRIRARKHPWMCNAGVACFIAAWIASATACSLIVGDSIPAAFALVLFQFVLYIAVYMRLVRGHWGHCRHRAVILGLRPQPRHPRDDGVLGGSPCAAG